MRNKPTAAPKASTLMVTPTTSTNTSTSQKPTAHKAEKPTKKASTPKPTSTTNPSTSQKPASSNQKLAKKELAPASKKEEVPAPIPASSSLPAPLKTSTPTPANVSSPATLATPVEKKKCEKCGSPDHLEGCNSVRFETSGS